MNSIPIEVWVMIAKPSEYTFNALLRALWALGRWASAVHCSTSGSTTMNIGYTTMNSMNDATFNSINPTMDIAVAREIRSKIINRRLDMMIEFGYSVCFSCHEFDDFQYIDWMKHGELHRNDGPARIWADGDVDWFKHGKPYRTDGGPSGVRYLDGHIRLHPNTMRNDIDHPSFMSTCGAIEWERHDKTHRIGGPASIHVQGVIRWHVHDKCYRKDGPARIQPDGTTDY